VTSQQIAGMMTGMRMEKHPRPPLHRAIVLYYLMRDYRITCQCRSGWDKSNNCRSRNKRYSIFQDEYSADLLISGFLK
jgi:hypothetical protein